MGAAFLMASCACRDRARIEVEPGQGGAGLAEVALRLMDRVVEVGLPATLPRWMARRLPPDEWGVVEDALRDNQDNPLYGFFRYEFMKGRDRDLYRDLRRFWSLPDSSFVEAIPGLAAAFEREREPKKHAILDLMSEVVGRNCLGLPSVDLPSDRRCRELAEPALVRILAEEKGSSYYDKIVDEDLSHLVPLSSRGIEFLLGELDAGPSRRNRREIVRALSATAGLSDHEELVRDVLLPEASDSACAPEQRYAISSSILLRYGADLVLPVYMRALQRCADKDFEIRWAVWNVLSTPSLACTTIPKVLNLLADESMTARDFGFSLLEEEVVPRLTELGCEGTQALHGSRSPLLADTWRLWWRHTGKRCLNCDGQRRLPSGASDKLYPK